MASYKKFSSMMVTTIVVMVTWMQFHGTIAGEVYTVGGDFGWKVPPNAGFYTQWAAHVKFKSTDVLWFNFTSTNHTVAEVSGKAYGPCIKENPIRLIPTGPDRISLLTLGPHYFICTKEDHCCRQGPKFTANFISG